MSKKTQPTKANMNTPKSKLAAAYTDKASLVGKLVPDLAGADDDKDVLRERLLTVSSAKLLRLAKVVDTVKKTYGSKDKLVGAIGAAEGKSKDADYLAKLATFPLPKLYDLAVSAERRNARA